MALQVAAFTTATRLRCLAVGHVEGPGGRVERPAAPGPGRSVIVGRLSAQPAVWVALQVAVLITETVPENGSEAYSVWVA